MGLREQVLVSNVYNGLEQPTSQRACTREDLSASPRSARSVLRSLTASTQAQSTKPGDVCAAAARSATPQLKRELTRDAAAYHGAIGGAFAHDDCNTTLAIGVTRAHRR